jgi:ABC-type multidrug transport system ATPase subunit
LASVPPRLRRSGDWVAVTKLSPGEEVVFTYEVECLLRGCYPLGPLLVEGGDLFGLYRRFRTVGEPHLVTVLPKVIPLAGWDLRSRKPLGRMRLAHRLFEDPIQVSGIRDYQPGDAMNRIHWRATARTGHLQTKTYDPSCVAGAAILLDFHQASLRGNAELFRTELAITAAASLAHAVLQGGQPTGLFTNGRDGLERLRREGWVGDFRTRTAARRNAQSTAQDDRLRPLAIEPSLRRVWDQRSAEAITMHFRVGKVSLTGNAITDFLGKLLPVVIIVVGAQEVFDQTLSVGALIAFQMLSGRVSGPLISMVGLVNEYQETLLSVRMLGEVMNRKSEGRADAGGLRPKLAGEIRFEQVSFRYPGATSTALNRATFTIPAGAIVGIVGRSGSGKTTLTKLIQGLYPLQEGVVRFDGMDAREIDLAHLRRQIGVVLQENFLFRGTVRENLMVAKPDASFEDIVAAAKASGAEEFIERMPQGYDTMLEENAANLSGGQKQRLSIARSLLTKPSILILDEAASALDPESESIFINNLSKIAVGRTVVMISHRLSTLVNAHAILVMQNGQLMDSGRHSELLTRCETYQTLWNQQTSHI